MTERVYYIAELDCTYNDTGNFQIKSGVKAYASVSEGYNSISPESFKNSAHQFREKPNKETVRREWTGHPWYYRVDDVKIIKVTEIFDKKEEYVE